MRRGIIACKSIDIAGGIKKTKTHNQQLKLIVILEQNRIGFRRFTGSGAMGIVARDVGKDGRGCMFVRLCQS